MTEQTLAYMARETREANQRILQLEAQRDDLLAALEAMYTANSKRKHPLGMPNEGISGELAEAASKARAAIAKARGQSNG